MQLFLLAVAILPNFCFAQGESQSFVNNDFANRPFGKVLTVDGFLEILDCPFTLEKKPISNAHNGSVDTVYCYTFFNSVMIFYKSSKSTTFRSAVIQDSGLKLMHGIEVGISKLEVIDKLKLPQTSLKDQIVITDEEDFAHHKLFFKNGKLAKVELDTGMD